MKFTSSNCDVPTMVFDVDRMEQLEMVMSIDTETGNVECYRKPFNVFNPTYTIKFRSIYPIFGGRWRPGLFHCYGRLN